ncbi:cell division protein FtsA, partial [Patescibacteria group bacterium]|nr:cell division protein FtsA [Patescibacteria group bacterium]
SIEDTVSSLSSALEQIERLIGLPVEHAWIGMGGVDIISQISKGVVAVAKSDGEIAEEDVERAVEAARSIAPPINYEMMHLVPRGYSVDGQTGIKDPAGMTGIRLEVETQIIHGLTSHIKNFTKAVYRAGIDIDDLVLSILAAGDAVTTQRQKELGTTVVNIGSNMTSMVVYEEGDIIHVATLPIGSGHVTNDLAIGLKTSIDVAEQVKLNFGDCLPSNYSSRDKIDLARLGAEESEKVNKKFIAEIIEARMSEIFEKVNQELTNINRAGLLPAGIVYTGGGAKVEGVINLSKEILDLPASLGYPVDILSSTEKINDLSFTTAIGLVKWGARLQPSIKRSGGKGNGFFSKAVGGTKRLLRSLIP